jgi:hypothetical protein
MPTYSSEIPGFLPGYFGYEEASQSASQGTVLWDVSIGGTSFLLAASPENPYYRQTAPIQKQQFDTSAEAGEQTLEQYWLRSQNSWHRGRGINFYEPGSKGTNVFEPGLDLYSDYRFDEAVGLDVWTRDQVTLLKKLDVLDAVSSSQVATVTTGKKTDGTNVVFTNTNGVIKRWIEAGTSTTITDAGVTTPVTRVAVCGGIIAVGHETGIDLCSVDDATLVTQWTQASGSVVYPYYAKGRIVAAIDNVLYTLPLSGASAAISTAGTVIHTHEDDSFRWTGVTDGPAAIYAAGNGGGSGVIYKFTLEDAGSGTLPALGQAYEVAQMPTGETIHCIKSYLGGYLGIGTSNGVRVALIDQNGNINYGPLIVETVEPVRDLEGNGSFIYAAVQQAIDTSSGVVRINLATPLPQEDLRFAHSWDVQTHTTGVPSSIGFFGDTDRICIGVTGEGVYDQSTTEYEESGYLLSGRIRFNTSEQKLFRLAVLRCVPDGGTVTLIRRDETETDVTLYSITDEAGSGDNITVSQSGAKNEYLQFKIILASDTDTNTMTPTLNSLVIKAIPAPRRQRLVQYPLACFDHERDSRGTPFGGNGFAWDRIERLETAESEDVILSVTDWTTGESYNGVVESVEFIRTIGRAQSGEGNFGGILKVTMRMLVS